MDVDVLEVPLPVPLRTRLIEITSAYLVLVRLGTDDGCDGVGFGAVLQHEYAKPLATLVDGMRPAVIGADPTMPESVRVALDRSLHKAGPGGLAHARRQQFEEPGH